MTLMPDPIAAHKRSSSHRAEIEVSEACGCFFCFATFAPSQIERWIDNGTTAMCPKCGIDSVIGSASGYPITEAFLREMYDHWFAR